MTKTRVEYDSNNSGGDWWLKDADWQNLDDAGWTVEWVVSDKWRAEIAQDGRWLGALATSAYKDFDLEPSEAIKAAIKEWEKITGRDASDEGCNCCGPPHSFAWGPVEDGGSDWARKEYVSGERILPILFDKDLGSMRDIYERTSDD